jgi:hypothetical protein
MSASAENHSATEQGAALDRVAALSTGTKLMVGAGALLFLDLFLTWQTLELEFGRGQTVTRALDGWDFWGLLIGVLTLALLAVVIVRQTEAEVMLDARWDVLPLALGTVVLALTVVKSVRDAESAWPSYLGIVLAGVVVVGAFLEWLQSRASEAPAPWQAQAASPADSTAIADRASDETRARW